MKIDNPIGFGTGDFIELALAALLFLLAILWPRYVEPVLRRLAEHGLWSLVLVALLPVVLRLALLRQHPAPGMLPAEWTLVLAEMAGFCGLCCWAARRWLGAYPGLVAGLLAVFWFGPLHVWANSYSGMYVPLCVVLVVSGLLPRFRIPAPPPAALRILIYLSIAEFVVRYGMVAVHAEPPRRISVSFVAPSLAPVPVVPEPPLQKDIVPGLRLEQVR